MDGMTGATVIITGAFTTTSGHLIMVVVFMAVAFMVVAFMVVSGITIHGVMDIMVLVTEIMDITAIVTIIIGEELHIVLAEEVVMLL